MKVNFSLPTRYQPYGLQSGVRVTIDFAIPPDGNSSSAEKLTAAGHQQQERSVRLSWWNADGRFDPISSAELPVWGLMDLIHACAERDFFKAEEAAEMGRVLMQSVVRQLAE